MAKGSRVNVTEKIWQKQKNKGMTPLQLSVLWRDAGIHLQPKDSLQFESDRYQYDGRYGAVLTIMLKEGANNKLPRAWGVNVIPAVSNPDVSVSLLMSSSQVPEKEVVDKMSEAVKSARGSMEEADESGQLSDATAAQQLEIDMNDVALEMQEGVYMDLSLRLNVTAPSEESLDRALREIEMAYHNWFSKVRLEQYIGEQQTDFEHMFGVGNDQLGYNYKMTSAELAGMSPFLTRGLEDEAGIFVGRLAADVNSGAVMLDTQSFKHLALVGARGEAVIGNEVIPGITKSSLWGVQYAQDALMRGHKVHQVVLNDVNPLEYGHDLNSITETVDMSKGQINILEVFGDKAHELELFAVQLEKLKLITKQMDPSLTEADLRLLGQVLERFYIDEKKWVPNAKNHVDELRLVGIPSSQVPKFEMISSYMQRAGLEARAGKNTAEYSNDDLRSIQNFQRLFSELYSQDGDIFARQTSLNTAKIQRSPQTMYTFKGMRRRGEGIFLAQVINALSYLAGNISRDDVVIVHGAELIDDSMYKYFHDQIQYYWNMGAKVVLLYNTPSAMLSSKMYDDANTIMIGPSTKTEMDTFASKFDNTLPQTVRQELSESGSESEYYFKRGMESALFEWEASL